MEYPAQMSPSLISTPSHPRFVAGALGPTPRTASISPDVNDPGARNIDFEALRQTYSEQLRGLLDGGIDVILVETIFDTLNAKAALFAIDEAMAEREAKGLPRLALMISGTVTDTSGAVIPGATITLVNDGTGVTAVQTGETIDAAFERADRLLYTAKSDGRDRVCAA